MIVGELRFYDELNSALSYHHETHPLGEAAQPLQHHQVDNIEAYSDLNDFSPWARVLLFSLIPFAIQASALMAGILFIFKSQQVSFVRNKHLTSSPLPLPPLPIILPENTVVPLAVIDTLKSHIDNFSVEIEQYLTILVKPTALFCKPLFT
jgi:hypothetical protein